MIVMYLQRTSPTSPPQQTLRGGCPYKLSTGILSKNCKSKVWDASDVTFPTFRIFRLRLNRDDEDCFMTGWFLCSVFRSGKRNKNANKQNSIFVCEV